MPTKPEDWTQRKMLRAYDREYVVAEEGQPLSDNQALALAMQNLAGAMTAAARDLLEAAKIMSRVY